MAESHGVTENTPQHTIYGPGVIVRNYDAELALSAQTDNIVGATKGGAEAEIIQEFVYPEFDGAKGKVAGTARLAKDSATLKFALLDITEDALLDALPGASASDSGTVVTITRSQDPQTADYLTNIALIADHPSADGSIGFVIANPLSTASMVIKTDHGSFAELSIEMEAHYSAAAMTTRPWTILWPSNEDNS